MMCVCICVSVKKDICVFVVRCSVIGVVESVQWKVMRQQ